MKVLLVARFVNRMGAFSMPFLASLLVHDHGASARVAGLVVGAFGLATIPSRLIGGLLATRVGTKPAVLIGLAGTAAAQLLVAAAPGLAVALVGAVLLGLCFEIYEPASQGLVADVTAEESLPRAYGLLGATLAAAGLLAGLLAAAVGRVGLSWLFAADAISAVACLVLVAAWLPATPPSGAGDGPNPMSSPWRDTGLWLLMTTGTTFAAVYMLIPMAMPLALVAADRPASDAGLLQALAALVIIAAQPLLRHSANITGRIVAGYGLLAVGLAVAGLHMTMAGYVAATIIIALGDVLLLGYSYTLVAAIAPEGSKATYFAIYGITWGVALTVGPPAMGQLLDNGFGTFWLACSAVMLATGIAQVVINRVIRVGKLERA
ncbi:MFS transporter [Saccharomonospora amisosensis]|uniref:MFS transporter n=1 Tax=Saccharomonospora amisosensis TaxID=1128677 RepID=UPI001ABBA7F6|nr:MFS transporter [Saccharomonospora amisosensis]